MKELIEPPSIPVEAPNHTLTTYFFRDDACLGKALSLARERRESSYKLSVVSAGCSIGAEMDSLLALHNRNQLDGHIDIKGIDKRFGVINLARMGRYAVCRVGEVGTMKGQRHILETYGFNVKEGAESPLELKVSSAPVRQRHNVSFKEFDLRSTAPLADKADLVMANNLLYHTARRQTYQVVRNLAGMVAEAGILSFGEITLSEHQTSWVEETMQLLARKFDLKPIEFGAVGQPVMFARE